MNPPSLIIVTNRGNLVAYRRNERGSLDVVDSETFSEGADKISEMVTDQAGAFPVGTGPATASFESLPLQAELQNRCFRQIAEKIQTIIDREKPGRWGFATSSQMNGAILDGMGEEYLRKLDTNLKLDITNSPAADVLKRFQKAAEPPKH